MTEQDRIDLPREVINLDNKRAIVISVQVINNNNLDNTEVMKLPLSDFLSTYREYIDPKDVEIAGLREALAKEKAKNKPERKPRRIRTTMKDENNDTSRD